MNLFYTILYGLTFLCFLIPFKKGKQQIAYIISGLLAVLITLTLIINLDILTTFIWLIIIMFQIIFISYWTFRKVITIVLSFGFLLLIMSPWISDYTFNKKDAKKNLRLHNIELRDDFKIIMNESGGLMDYYERFTLQLSDNDFNRISQSIKTSKNYKGVFTNHAHFFLSTNYKMTDTLDFETDNYFEREYWTNTKMKNGTFHFRFELNKKTKELSYIGSNE